MLKVCSCDIWTSVDVDGRVHHGQIAQLLLPLFCISFIILSTRHRNCVMMNSEGFGKKSTLVD